jgi:hypothetical protein
MTLILFDVSLDTSRPGGGGDTRHFILKISKQYELITYPRLVASGFNAFQEEGQSKLI